MADDVKKTIIIEAKTDTKQAEEEVKNLKGALNEVENAADKASGGLLSTFKKLAKNPYIAAIGLAISGLVGFFNKLKDAISKSDDAGTAFGRLLALLKVPLQIINQLFDALANSLGKVANTMADVIKSIMPAKWREQADAEDELVVATDRLEDAEREYAINHAERQREIADLRNKATQGDKYSLEQRIRFLSDAIRAENEDLRERKRIVDEKIRLFELEHRNEKSWSDEAKNAYNQLRIEKVQADTEILNSQRRLNSAMTPLVNELINRAGDLSISWKGVVVSIKEVYAETLKIRLQDALKGSADEIQKVVESFDAISKYLTDEEYDRAIEARQKLLHGYYVGGADGAREVAEANRELNEVLSNQSSVSWDYLRGSIQSLDTQMQNTLSIVDEVETAVNDAISEADKIRKQSQQKAVDGVNSTLEGILQKNKEINDGIFANTIKNYGDIERETASYNRIMTERANERAKILAKIQSAQTKNIRDAYQEQLRLFDTYTMQLTRQFYQTIAGYTTKLPPIDSSELVGDLQDDGFQIKESLGEFSSDFASMVDEDVDSVAFNLDLLKERIKNWVNTNAENIQMTASIFGAVADIMGSASSMIQDEYDAIMAKGDEMTASDIAQAKALAEKQKTIADAQIVLNEVMSIGNSLVAASAAAAQSGIAAPVVFAATLATLTASIIGMIAQLHQNSSAFDAKIKELDNIKAEKGFATGGYVEGAGTATSDSIPARLSNGEAVINAKSTSMFYDLLSRINQAGGGVAFPNAQNSPILHFARGGVANNTQTTIEALKQALNGVQPVVSVKEITRVQNKLKIKEI